MYADRWLTYIIDLENGKSRIAALNGRLTVHQMEREPVDGVIKGDAPPSAGHILQIVHLCGLAFLGQGPGGLLEIFFGLDHESGAAKLGLGGCLEREDEGLRAVAPVKGPLAYLRCLLEAKIVHKLLCLVDLFMLVVDVRNAHQVDLLEMVVWESGSHGGDLGGVVNSR